MNQPSAELGVSAARASPVAGPFGRWAAPGGIAVLLCLLAGYLAVRHGDRQGWLLLVGIVLGLALYHATFGFSTAWRNFVVNRRGAGLRAQMLMLAIGVCLFFPPLAAGQAFGIPVSGFVRPLGFSVIFGAFIFGFGMQLGNGCASGNLYHVGGGQLRAIPSMLGFAVGALWATAHYEWWTTLPQLAPFSFIDTFGVVLAVLINLAIFTAIAWLSSALEKRRHGSTASDDADGRPARGRLLRGPWPMVWGAVVLAVMNFVTLLLLGRPWAVALAYPLWGAKGAALLGMDLELDFWVYWLQPGREEALAAPLLADATTVMNVGIIAGALLAAVAGGRFFFEWRLPWQQWIAALLGGLLLGYGATIAFGCNIGAYFGGIVSGSAHGWLWLVAAYAGSALGIRCRPFFKLPNPSSGSPC